MIIKEQKSNFLFSEIILTDNNSYPTIMVWYLGDNEELNDLFILKEKNKEFSSIIHTMRHDIRNYIAAIEGYAYLLRDEFNEDYLKRIFTNIENINVLVDRSVLFADAPLDIEKSS